MQRRDVEDFVGLRDGWWKSIFRDVQFWVPITVLLIGLVLLKVAQ